MASLTAALVDDPTLVKDLYSACRAMLPSYMIPKFVVISPIPLNPSGKVDERGLSKIVEASLHSNPDGVTHPIGSAISTAMGLDNVLATIVAARFFGNKPSITDDLRYYGLTSLDFMGFIKDIQTTLGISLTLGQVFRNPNLRSIAKIVKEKLSHSPTNCSPSSSRAPDQNGGS
ncbi:hypothetical protein OEA41_001201 [Lepraria neglecta]|uniref:Carrier domain-containing protein n=1 Tax=Lepraria neglecta TaxID=209136 RepID=A0AAD9ZJR1_9LECA|nr:hypothetical protein OEA41_001201 [Lepraria neglecta]